MLKCSAIVLALLLTIQAGVLPVWASEETETVETENALLPEGTEEVFPEEETEELLPEEGTEEVFPEEETEESVGQEPDTEEGTSAGDSTELFMEEIPEEETTAPADDTAAAADDAFAVADDTAAAEKLKEELSKNGNGVTQYVNDEDQKIKTTVWVKGVTPPDISEFIKCDPLVAGAERNVYRPVSGAVPG